MLRVLSAACIRLTQGQHLDLSFENAAAVAPDQYLAMIGGKTAALIETACGLGALSAGAPAPRIDSFRRFGRSLGLAFQMQDDYLGVWGDPAVTGKSAASDLEARKKNLPILIGLERSPEFRSLLAAPEPAAHLRTLLALLEECGAREETLRQANEEMESAFAALAEAAPSGECGAALRELAESLDRREK
jgi:geranylgeranyl diphosphate synthase type I